MINQKIIKPISLSLALLIISPSIVQASSLSDIIMTTSTSAGTWDAPLGGGTYLYGGDFKMKLKTNSYYAPLFSYKMPSVKVGCSGISINGGFLQFLGLDKLQDQLSNAGSSLMFGIILGMEFTLPAVSAVFAKIRAWANALQAMLQNGCNIGRAISAGSGAAKSLRGAMLSTKINEPFDKLNDFISGGFGDSNDSNVLGAIQALANCSGDPTDPNCDLEKVAKIAMGKQLKSEQDNSNIASNAGATAKVILNTTNPLASASSIATMFSLSSFYQSKKISCSQLTTHGVSDSDILIDKLKYIFFGDIGSDDESMQSIAFNIDESTCSYKLANMANKLAGSVTTGESTAFNIPQYSRIQPIIGNPRDAAEILVYGFNRVGDKYADISGSTITIPDRNIMYLDFPLEIDDDGNPTSRTRAIFVSSKENNSTASNIDISWDGAFKESLKGIKGIVNARTGQTWSLDTSATYEEYSTSSVGTISTPLLIPSAKKFANVIARIEKSNGGETQLTLGLKVKLAKYNAIEFSKGLINGIQTRALALSKEIHGDPQIINDYLQNITETEYEINILLKEMAKEIEEDKLIGIFQKLEGEQRLESLKAKE